MQTLNPNDVKKYVEKNIDTFHFNRIESLKKLKLDSVLEKKNPYLFKAKNLEISHDVVSAIVNAFTSSAEETVFGNFLEGLAIFVNQQVYGGWKSSANGIDLEFNKDGIRYIVAIKSGPNWANSSQLKKLIFDFNSAIKTLRTGNSNLHIVAVNGCCYGRDNKPDKNGVYYKYCGQRFWEFISGDSDLYKEIIQPLGIQAREKNELYLDEYSKLLNKFTYEFTQKFCFPDGSIDWGKIIELNSSTVKPRKSNE